MNTVSASLPTAPAAQSDMGPLAWLLDQISDNLQSARTALKRAAQQHGEGVLAAPGAEAAALRGARTQVHQAAGAIELLGFFGAARLTQAAETALDRLVDHPEQLGDDALLRFETGFNALVDYLEAQRAGKNEPALKLYPQYRGLLELAQAERIHPADLWDHDWTWPDAPAEPGSDMLQEEDRGQYEQALLHILRGQQIETATRQLDAVARRAQHSSKGPTASLWWLSRGVLEALGAGLLTLDPDIKRLLNRLNLQLRSQLMGQNPAPQRLGHDLAFFCAQALHAGAGAAQRPTPLLHAIDQKLELGAAPFADYRQSHFGLIDPALVQQARKRAQTLREAWSALAGHAQTPVDAARMARLIELSQGLRQPLQALTPGSEVLPEALSALFRKISGRTDFLTPERALDAATAILFLEITFGHFRPEEQHFLERAQILAHRLQQSAEGVSPDPLASWMEDLFRQASETQTMGSVVHELRADMNTVEKLLDAFFRDPAQKPELAQVPRLLSQMRGVFSVLGVDVAGEALGYLREEIDDLLADGTPAPDTRRFDALASNIGALGFLVDMLAYQPELAKTLFVFDRDHKELHAVVASAPRTAPPTLKQDVEQSARHLVRDIAQGLAPGQTEQRLAQLRAEAEIAGVPDMTEQILQASAAAEREAMADNGAAPSLAAPPVSPPAEFQGTGTIPAADTVETLQIESIPSPADAPATDAQDDLTEIFLEEAYEVIATGHAQVALLRGHPNDDNALATLRRAFHTLKGSSRMVGLRDYGEAAWALEQLFNRQIAEQQAASPGLLDLASHALDQLNAWAVAIGAGQAEGFSSVDLQAAAHAYAPDQTPEPTAAAALVPVPSEAAPRAPELAFEAAALAPLTAPVERPEIPAPEVEAAHHDFAADLDALLLQIPASPAVQPASFDQTAAPEPGIAMEAEPEAQAAATSPTPPPADFSALLDGIDLDLPQGVEDTQPAEAGAVVHVEELDMEAFEAAMANQAPTPPASTPPVEEDDAPYKIIGDLRIPTPLYTIYLAEADELSRHLAGEIHAWLDDPQRPVGDHAVTAAHKLAGSSATVGLQSVAELAGHVEHALDALRECPADAVLPPGLAALAEAAADIKQLLHQFAAGLLKPAPGELLARLATLTSEAEARIQQAAASMRSVQDAELQPAEDAVHVLAEALPPVPEPSLPAESAEPIWSAPAAKQEMPAPAAPAAHAPAIHPADQLVDSIDPDLFPIFEEEANELLPALAASLRQWELHPMDADPAAGAMRTLHTLKGSARMAGAMQLGDMAHSLESDIDGLVSNPPVSEADLTELLSRFDHLNARFDRLRDAAQRGESQLLDLPPGITPTVYEVAAPVELEVAAAPKVDAPQGVSTQVEAAALQPAAAITTPFAEPPAKTAAPRIAAQAVRVRAGLLDRLVNQAGEISISRARLESEFSSMRTSAADLGDNLERLRQQVREIEIQAEAQMSAQVQAARDEHRDFDPLEFDRFTRTQELTRMMAESVNDIGMVQATLGRLLRDIDDDMTRQARQTRDLQRDLLRTRMVEFDSLSERLYRTVRQAAKDLNKSVRLDIQGGNIEIDRGVLDRMAGSFDHLLRNAVAHGIESPEERQAAGKPATGTITLALRQDGNEVVITLADDGRGLNYAAIRSKAEKLGLITPEQAVNDDELAQLVFRPNFSSAESTTAVAGRGVGLDVVRTEVNALGGRVLLDNQPGAGARFTLLLPLTTAITQVVLLRTGQKVYAVPANLVEIVLRYKPEQIAAAANTLSADYAGTSLPFYWFGALLGQSGSSSEPFGKSVPVVVIRSATQRVAVQVDEVLGNREVVVKNLGQQLARVPGLAGISVLPSGDAALIYNPVALAAVYGDDAVERMHAPVSAFTDLAQTAADLAAHGVEVETAAVVSRGAGQAVAAQTPPERSPQRGTAPLIMVVDDSITVRRVTQRFLTRNGYLVQLAKDGLDALEQLQQTSTLPDVILLDIEMPRMDGFDLTRNIRADSRLKHLPIIMITSRIADKHRNYAAQLGVNHYLGKPYSETELLLRIQEYTAAPAG